MKRFFADMKTVFNAACVCAVSFLLLAGTVACEKKKSAPSERKSNVVFQTDPAGASVSVVGITLKKTTPAECILPAGVYVVKFVLPGYRTQWRKFEVKSGSVTTVKATLIPFRSSVLIAAKADGKYGVQVHYKGKYIGETPLVLQNLPLGDGEVLLTKNGYAGKREVFTVRDSLPPPAITVSLNSNRGRLYVDTFPAGAEIFIDGQPMGVTPLVFPVGEGQHQLELKKKGFRSYSRSVDVTRSRDTRIGKVTLQPLPAHLRVTSSPAGAELFINGDSKGKADGRSIELPPGKYSVLVRRDGFDDTVKDVVLNAGETIQLNMDLDTLMGALEIVTRPAGVAVWVDNKLIGRSKPDPANPKYSEVLRVPNVRQGRHSVTIVHKRAKWNKDGKRTVYVNVEKGKTARVEQIELWVPDIKILLKDGRVEEGRFLYYQPDGSVHYQPRPGMGITRRKELVQSVEKLPIEDE
ncbi:MAG: PEGA domain-containing protein [Lentisphaeria bacterium]|nr:PEGA domain-containing protein [Lentisphaeria bacterium]